MKQLFALFIIVLSLVSCTPNSQPTARARCTLLFETSFYDDNFLSGSSYLYTDQGQIIAVKKHQYSPSNTIRTKVTIIEYGSRKVINESNCDENGNPVEPRYLCLDKKGRIICDQGQPVLVKISDIGQKSIVDFDYSRHKISSMIFSSTYCAEATGLPECSFIW